MATSLAWARGLEDSKGFFRDLRDLRLENWTCEPSKYALKQFLERVGAHFTSTKGKKIPYMVTSFLKTMPELVWTI